MTKRAFKVAGARALAALACALLLGACQGPAEPDLVLDWRSAGICSPHLATAQAAQDAWGAGDRQAAPHATAVPVAGELLVAYRTDTVRSHGDWTTTTTGADAASTVAPASAGDLVGAAVRSDFGLVQLEAAAAPGLPELVAAADSAALVNKLREDPRVLYAHQNYYLEALYLPHDPLYSQQWHLHGFGLEQAWDAYLAVPTRRDVVIAVIDTGIDATHPDLAAKLLPGWDFHSMDADTTPGVGRASAHGTHVAGIAAASGGNDGITGVAFVPNVSVLPVKVFDDRGEGGTILDLIRAIRWSTGASVPGAPRNDNPARVINLSVGVPGVFPSLDAAVRAAWDAGTLVVAAAGNHSAGMADRGVLSPANAPCAIAVGSVDLDRRVSAFSNTGPELELVAPGGYGTGKCAGVISTLPGGRYGCMSGTSMAAPFVAGVAALVMSQGDHVTPDTVRALLSASTSQVDEYLISEGGNGLVCADAALGAVTRCGQLIIAPSQVASSDN